MTNKLLRIVGVFFTAMILFPSAVFAAVDLSGSNSFTGTSGVALSITDLQLTGTSVDPVPVKLRVTSGTLSMSTTTGLTFDGSTSGSEIYFSGSVANLNAALATLTYTKTTAGDDTLEVSLVTRGEVFFPDNGHLYEFITGTITATNARTAAAGLTSYGATGYLATITSQEENDFVAARLQGDGWMGAGDIDVEGDWKWLTGPEAGTSFWSGASGGSTVGGNYANWSTGEPNDYNNGVPGEDCAQFYISTGMWNDLPCTGTTLSGYVVEFGATGDLPTVASKDIDLDINPAINTLSPADNATEISVSANLVITFRENVTKGTGNLLIRRTSDDSLVESIDVTSGQVTGGGTSTITINPTSDLTDTTEYYVIIPGTAFHDGSSHYFAGISSTTAWSFTTIDLTDPEFGPISATSITNSGATITWTTGENSSSQVNYGLTSSYGTNTAETNTSPRVTSHSVALSSLLSCTTYHYRVVSTDAASNTATSSDKTFTTTGCPANQAPSKTTSNSITSNTGGTTSLSQNNSQISVNAPSNFTDDAASVVIQIKAVAGSNVLSSIGRPSSLPNEVGPIVFDVTAIINGTTVLDSFDSPVTITYQYADEDLGNLQESTLWLYHYHNGAWQALDSCTLDTAANTISCTTPSFSIFGLFGNSPSSGGGDNPSAPACANLYPTQTPDLFQIDVTDTQATLFFTPLMHNVTNYFISYGYTSGEERFGTFTNYGPSTGVLSYTINHLNPNSEYFFKVRPHNDCVSGEWSNELSVTTTGKIAKTKSYYEYMQQSLSLAQAVRPSSGIGGPESQILGATSNKLSLSDVCEYVVKPGDSLWDIALEKYQSGFEYSQIMSQNQLTSSVIYANQRLTLSCAHN